MPEHILTRVNSRRSRGRRKSSPEEPIEPPPLCHVPHLGVLIQTEPTTKPCVTAEVKSRLPQPPENATDLATEEPFCLGPEEPPLVSVRNDAPPSADISQDPTSVAVLAQTHVGRMSFAKELLRRVPLAAISARTSSSRPSSDSQPLTGASEEWPRGTRPAHCQSIASQPEFRKRFFQESSHKRLLHAADGCLFRLIPMIMNGDCGFAAIAKGVNLHTFIEAGTVSLDEHRSDYHRVPSARNRTGFNMLSKVRRRKELSPRDVRRLLAEEVSKNRRTYTAISAGLFSDTQLTTFVNNVVRPGMTGHWLGAEMGGLEFVAVARALNITLAIYCFDVPSQTVRRFEEARSDEPRNEVCLFFTGPAASGHFDLLWRVSPLQKLNIPRRPVFAS